MAEPGRPVAQSLAAFAKPLIAAINGPAFGGGLELALACDLRVAARGATFALPEVTIGSLPGSGGTQRLVRAIGPAVAARMLFSGEPLSAADALRTGLISDLVEPGELADFTGGLARKISANAPLSLLAAKQCLTAAGEAQLSAGLELERALWTLLATTEDRREGRAAFREHRAPRFTGN
jgi:enoyl-CoA hydratase/carnithine racemase